MAIVYPRRTSTTGVGIRGLSSNAAYARSKPTALSGYLQFGSLIRPAFTFSITLLLFCLGPLLACENQSVENDYHPLRRSGQWRKRGFMAIEERVAINFCIARNYDRLRSLVRERRKFASTEIFAMASHSFLQLFTSFFPSTTFWYISLSIHSTEYATFANSIPPRLCAHSNSSVNEKTHLSSHGAFYDGRSDQSTFMRIY